jgi:hypothetical protein
MFCGFWNGRRDPWHLSCGSGRGTALALKFSSMSSGDKRPAFLRVQFF